MVWLRHVLIAALVTLGMSLVFQVSGPLPLMMAIFGLTVGSGMFLFTTFLVPYLHKRQFLEKVVFTGLGLVLTFVIFGLFGMLVMFFSFELIAPSEEGFSGRFEIWKSAVTHPISIQFLIASVFVAVTISFVQQILRKLGKGILWNWMTGRYHDPVPEERIILFLDLRDSTSHAERLAPLEFARMLQRFIADVATSIEAHGGIVSHYIGDEVVATWIPERGLKNASCLLAIEQAHARLTAHSPTYERDFGVSPSFKAALHLGQVISTEVGNQKSEIVQLGDAMNTTARLQAVASDHDGQLVVSEALSRRLPREASGNLIHQGDVSLKGKSAPESVLVYRLSSGARIEKPGPAS
ncbi:MAG: adenylate/guanylate cyclase domain-containing protein [Armatimonadetes bacterium]|nr:adenylate/guanylate cyclase domain-containing protein [Armatimonadota bacterium]